MVWGLGKHLEASLILSLLAYSPPTPFLPVMALIAVFTESFRPFLMAIDTHINTGFYLLKAAFSVAKITVDFRVRRFCVEIRDHMTSVTFGEV
jgi:hypothetical protein